MPWFDVADGRLRFTGRMTKDPVREWLRSDDGRTAVDALAAGIRFSLIGRRRSARRRLGRQVWNSVTLPAMRRTLTEEGERYLAVWSQLAYAPSLPRLSVALQRVVVVPRVMIVSRTAAGITARVTACLRGSGVPDAFSAFFSEWIVARMDAAIRQARPRPGRPIAARESWVCVAVDTELVWVDPLWTGPEWRGYVVMYEKPAAGLGRRQRQELTSAIGQLTGTLPNLARPQRDHLVRLASDQMGSLVF